MTPVAETSGARCAVCGHHFTESRLRPDRRGDGTFIRPPRHRPDGTLCKMGDAQVCSGSFGEIVK